MSIRIVRLGSTRQPGEGLRLGTVRRPPRGVSKADYARLDYFDVWFPNLAPSAELLKQFRVMLETHDEVLWPAVKKRFVAEMAEPAASRDLDLLAALSHRTDVSVGCYCDSEHHCHRSILRELLLARGAAVVPSDV
ncbi:DUF488 domain-containing protein [Jeongeupia naejangsanensis]|uniref:DUF488 family protein n=1 Tax=Jeongeupia naejangsanensis TaxID=613195 RepID=A0ABS2BMA4_9NEIS|nr:DUF488 family protein [Jeongeupia naejangsanensis]MBM3116762.1 DUF488 family protein [Jeongeupia naejangsanensis]